MNIILRWIFGRRLKFPKGCLPELKEAAYFLGDKYKLDNTNFKFTKKSFTVLINKKFNRKDLIKEIALLPNYVYEGKGSSSLGRLKYKDKIVIYFKPKELQGDNSPGKSNEKILEKEINKYINKGTNINFISSQTSHSIFADSVVNTSDTGSNKYFKSDVQFIRDNKIICNVSIKKEGGFIWESSVKRYKYVYDKFISSFLGNYIENLVPQESTELPGKYLMINPINNKPYGRIIIKSFPEYNDENIIFGNETPKPIIVEKTFTPSDFSFSNNTLNIKVNHIYSTIEEIEKDGKLPVLAFSRNMGKPYGLDFKCVPENKTIFTYKANILELPYDVLMKS